MIHKIVLKNFLAHKNTELRLGPGMTVLTGPNNSGKSAVVEGLRCVAQNPTPRHFIRHGATEARVTVEVDDGTKITWIRKKATVIYEVLRPGAEVPEVYRKLKKGEVPEEVLDLLRLDPVNLESGRANERSVDVHIGNQRKPIFLLADDSADTRMAEFFAASSESAHLLAMQKLLKNRIREAKTEEKGLLRRMDGLATDLDRLVPLPDLSLELARAAEMDEATRRSGQFLPQLEAMLDRDRALRSTLDRSQARSVQMVGLAPPPVIHDTPALEQVLGFVETLGTRIAMGSKRQLALSSLAEPPELHSTTLVAEIILKHNELTSQVKKLAIRSSELANLQEPPMLFDEEPLAGLLRDIQGVKARQAQLAKVLEARQTQVESLRTEIEARMAEIGDCPLCGAPLKPGSLLGKEGS
ncbi:MAG: AAA family ATPase [Proteobacteria bacterium]|nr:AAA family ATPase [Pseudomonadota bacterium]MBU1612015.1 AAA family ATPase [Pseudomonadota bacterium]